MSISCTFNTGDPNLGPDDEKNIHTQLLNGFLRVLMISRYYGIGASANIMGKLKTAGSILGSDKSFYLLHELDDSARQCTYTHIMYVGVNI